MVKSPRNNSTWKCRFNGGKGSTSDLVIRMYQHGMDGVAYYSGVAYRDKDSEHENFEDALTHSMEVGMSDKWPFHIEIIPNTRL